MVRVGKRAVTTFDQDDDGNHDEGDDDGGDAGTDNDRW